MLSSERVEKILEHINEKGSVEVKKLSEEFHVSEITIRRDLNKLEEKGLLFRTHGGARRKKPLAQEIIYDEKKFENHDMKVKIAKKAMELIEDKMTILLDAGTTTFELAQLVTQSNLQELTVVTNDIKIAYHLHDCIEVVMLGGYIVKQVGNTQGFLTRKALNSLYLDQVFLGTSAINEKLDLFTPSEEKVELKRLMIERCDTSVLLVDQSKFEEVGLYFITNGKDFDYIITDKSFDGDQSRLMEKHHTQIIHVKEDVG